MADPDFQIREGGQSKKKKLFLALQDSFWSKINGDRPPGPLRSATDQFFIFQVKIKLLKATQKGKKSKGVFEVVLGNRNQGISHRRPSTNPSPKEGILILSDYRLSVT